MRICPSAQPPLIRFLAAFGLFGALVLLPAAASALDAVLYLGDIVGGNTTSGRVGSMVVEAYSFSQVRIGSAGITSFSPVTVIKPVDQASPKLLFGNAVGVIFPTGRLEVFGSNPAQPEFTIEMLNVTIDTIAPASGLSGARESVGLRFTQVTWTYNTGSGVVEECWNLSSMTSC